MTATEVFDLTTAGGATDFARVIRICERLGGYCLIGGLALNSYVEPVYTLDADLVVYSSQSDALRKNLKQEGFRLTEEAHSLNAKAPGSDLRIQFTTDARYEGFIARAEPREILGQTVQVAALRDLVQGKIWAYQDTDRRASKRKKDELDLLRVSESYPAMRVLIPEGIQRAIGL